ncbi:MAG: trypsin-like peptidase domain-containing protein [Hydrogenophilaceae bacterium]|jgi:hypothetical protein|nr:trypsin-like peptidase domain-containing protein [Hydrogenophilaceae bacterium]
MNIADQIIHTTVRIETLSANGVGGSGTGFFMRLCADATRHVPVIVSNKHVIAGAALGTFRITLSKGAESTPDLGQFVGVPISDFEQGWIKHPDPNIDLAVFPLAPVMEWMRAQGKSPYFVSLSMDDVADAQFMGKLSAAEDIVMIGYPTGLWDTRHNLPIVRRGITATPPAVDFDGKPEFMIDCGCFPGSSGSPVLLYNVGGYHEGNNFNIGTRVKLLGVLWGGPQFTAQGEIRAVPVPTATQPIALSRIPINLGYCVKATELTWFEEHFKSIVAANGNEVGDVEQSATPAA